jgi:hypothetical protein
MTSSRCDTGALIESLDAADPPRVAAAGVISTTRGVTIVL